MFLRLLQKQREPLLIKCQPLTLLLCLHPAKAREALDETVAFQARQTGQRRPRKLSPVTSPSCFSLRKSKVRSV